MSNPTLKIALCQLNLTTGDFEGNFRKAEKAVSENDADLYVFPESQVSNAPSADLYLDVPYLLEIDRWTKRYQELAVSSGKTIVFGAAVYRFRGEDGVTRPTNCLVAACPDGSTYFSEKVATRSKDGGDQSRWFEAGEWPSEGLRLPVGDGEEVNVGLFFLDDVFLHGAIPALENVAPEIMIVADAAPYACDGWRDRDRTLMRIVVSAGHQKVPVVFANRVGGNDEAVWNGRSIAMDWDGTVHESVAWAESVEVVTYEKRRGEWVLPRQPEAEKVASDIERYVAVCIGLRDYMAKTGFGKAVLGLSGGADSALVALMASDVLGAENVHFIMMPTNYTSGASNELAMDLAAGLGADSRFVAVQPLFDAYRTALAAAYGDTVPNVAEENLQAQIRGDLLSWHSNKFGAMILSTGNKSEAAMGYATLYGDMRGGYNPLKDLYKTEVFELLEMRLAYALGNRDDFGGFFERSTGRKPARLRKVREHDGPAALRAIIDRPPSAELAEGQLDSDSLPDYPVLDKILHAMIENDDGLTNEEVAKLTRESVELVEQVRKRLRIMEYKRFQSCPGPKIQVRSLTGRDWQYPMASAWRE